MQKEAISSLIAGLVVFCTFAVQAESISEIHYDNAGADTGEFVEVTGPAGTNLENWSLVFYNGSNGTVYNTFTFTAADLLVDQGGGQGTAVATVAGIQNGAPDGIALVDPSGTVMEFLSYEGAFTAVGGPADGQVSEDIGVAEASSTPIGESLQRNALGDWSGPLAATPGELNGGGATSGSAFINELHYDNAGSDVNELVEVAGTAGLDLSGWEVAFYNGSNGTVYDTLPLSGTLADQADGFGTLSFLNPSIQNGSPDGLALVDAAGDVVEFLSYEGALTASDGPANGMTSADIGVAESSSTPIGQSLQRTGQGLQADDFVWTAADESPGAINAGQVFSDAPPVVARTTYEIQGSGDVSPLDGQVVSVQGVVVGDFQTGAQLRGFFIQDVNGDGDAATSDGLFVFDGNGDVDVAVGDLVELVGTVGEFFGSTQLSQLSSVTVIGTADLPAPVEIGLPAATRENSDRELIVDLEQYESMLVAFPDTLSVTELFNLDRFGEMRLAQGGRLFQFTNSNLPDSVLFAQHQQDAASRLIILDDGSAVQNPDPIIFPAPGLSSSNPVRMGDTVTDLTGVLAFRRGSGGSGDEAYRLMPTQPPEFVSTPRPERPEVGGELKVASFNVLNFFNTTDVSGNECAIGTPPVFANNNCRGADSDEELARQTEKLVTAMLAADADIYGLIEIENDYPEGELSSIATLAAAMNTATGSSCDGGFDYVNPGDRVGDDAIAVGLIYCANTVGLTDGAVPATLSDANLPDGFVAPIFNGNATNRVPLAVTFDQLSNGAELTVVVNHFKSKGSSGLFGTCQADPMVDVNCDQADGQGFWNDRRTQAAGALAAWLQTNPTGSDDADVLVLGDLNAYQQEDPIQTLQLAGFDNLLSTKGEGDEAYSFVFDSQAGALDYALSSSSLSKQVSGIAEWHINADEADALDYNLDFGRNPDLFDGSIAFRASDHDPLLVGLNLRGIGIDEVILAYWKALRAKQVTGSFRFALTLYIADFFADRGRKRSACVFLNRADLLSDGAPKPRDAIRGEGVADINALIGQAQASLQCGAVK